MHLESRQATFGFAHSSLGGEGFTPILDSFKNLFGDISSLEEFGSVANFTNNTQSKIKKVVVHPIFTFEFDHMPSDKEIKEEGDFG